MSADAHAVAYTYHPHEITLAQVAAAGGVGFSSAGIPRAPAPVVGPQCSAPTGYLVALERLRFALNLRRLFMKV